MTKFKVGDTVRMKCNPKIRLFILETTVQTCYSNCEQEWYTGRVFHQIHGDSSMAKNMDKFSLIELEAIPEDSPQIKKLKKELIKTQAQKMKFIKEQDFAKAAEVRDQLAVLKENITRLGGEVDGSI